MRRKVYIFILTAIRNRLFRDWDARKSSMMQTDEANSHKGAMRLPPAWKSGYPSMSACTMFENWAYRVSPLIGYCTLVFRDHPQSCITSNFFKVHFSQKYTSRNIHSNDCIAKFQWSASLKMKPNGTRIIVPLSSFVKMTVVIKTRELVLAPDCRGRHFFPMSTKIWRLFYLQTCFKSRPVTHRLFALQPNEDIGWGLWRHYSCLL